MSLTKTETFTLISLIVFLIAINYSWLDSLVIDSFSDDEFVKVDRVIDGDTIKSNENSIRLLGINTPEKGEKYYREAKDSLNEKILNKTVGLNTAKIKKTDITERLLIFFLIMKI